MLRSLLILIIIAILAAIGAASAFRLISWAIGVLVNVAIVVVAFMGIVFLIKKLRNKT